MLYISSIVLYISPVTDDELADLVMVLRRVGAEIGGVEVKRAREKLPSSMVESISAFSNSPGGGVILLGVDEAQRFAVTGVPDPKTTMAKVQSLCADAMQPAVRPYIQAHEFEGEVIISVEIPEIVLAQKPCFYRGAGEINGAYRRVGDADQRMTSYEVQQLIAGRGQPLDDLSAVVGATIDDLDPHKVDAFLNRLRKSRPSFVEESPESALRRMRVLVPHQTEARLVPSLAGLLALGKHPQDFLPQLNITFVHYPTTDGPDTGTRFVDNRSIDGSIVDLVQGALLALRANMRRRAVVTGFGRQDIWDYPEAVLREAIVNAVVHRDYSPAARGAQIQIEMYPDRLVIRNPGGLFGAVNLARLGEPGVSSSRNAALLRILEDVVLPEDDRPICENRGSGMRVMVRALEAMGMSPPVFDDSIATFTVVFRNATILDEDALRWLSTLGAKDLSESQCFGLVLMRGGQIFTNATYRNRFLLDSRIATQELGDLVRRGLVEQFGSRRWTSYRLSERPSWARVGSGPMTVLRYLEEHGPAPRSVIADSIQANHRTVLAWLARLQEVAPPLVQRVGPVRSPQATYELTDAGQRALAADL